MDDIPILELAAHGWDEGSPLAGDGNDVNLASHSQVFHHSPNKLSWNLDVCQAHFSTSKAMQAVDLG